MAGQFVFITTPSKDDAVTADPITQVKLLESITDATATLPVRFGKLDASLTQYIWIVSFVVSQRFGTVTVAVVVQVFVIAVIVPIGIVIFL